MRFKKFKPPYNIQGIPVDIKAEDVNEDGTFKGIASPFGGEPDSHNDVIVKGAYEETIMKGGRNGNGVVMLYQHDPDKAIGLWPVLRETEEGLYVEGQLELQLETARKCHIQLQKGIIKGLSIGYDIPRTTEGEWAPDAVQIEKDSNGRYIRYLKRLILWEISPVVFPASIRTSITGVKDFANCKTERDYENVLRESGLSKSAAQHIVKLIKPSLRESKGVEENTVNVESLLLQELQKRRKRINDF